MAAPGTNPTYQYLDSTNADGTMLGQSATTSKISFFAATPIVQPLGSAQGVTGVVSMGTISGAVWGFSSSATFYATVQLIEAMRTVLVNLGLMKGSA